MANDNKGLTPMMMRQFFRDEIRNIPKRCCSSVAGDFYETYCEDAEASIYSALR